MNGEQVLEIKLKGESLMRQFSDLVTELNKNGYKVEAQPDGTLYIYKIDVVESYGERKNAANSQGK